MDCFRSCPFKYQLRYLDRLRTIPDTDPANALILGTALHTGIEQGVAQAVEFYQDSFPVLTDEHINEVIKLETMIPKAAALLPPGGRFEVPIGNADFIGFIDYLAPAGKGLNLDGLITGEDLEKFEAFDLYDFKYSNNSKSYMESGQLHEYKYWFELTHPGCRIRNLYFLFVPKVKIRQKKTESLIQFRERLRKALADATPWVEPVQYNPLKIVNFLTDAKHMIEAQDFPRNPNHFCGWCEYEEFCQKGWDYMILPKNQRRNLDVAQKKVIWVYGAPFSGKTFFANCFPDPLMLNTDGNIKFVDAPFISIRDTVTVEGRLTKRLLAYEVFTDAVAELEKKQNDFKTIVVDLLEDVYEACRVYICDRQGWKHESDDSFRAWDMVRSEFLNTLKRLMALDYENIVLISHEDRTRDLTRKGGDKISSIKPNLQDKVANKVAGMVDLVARIVADGDDRQLSFKTSEVIFGGGRLTVHNKEIPLDYAAFCQVYQEANQRAAGAAQGRGGVTTPPNPETADSAPQTGRRRARKSNEEPAPADPVPGPDPDPAPGEGENPGLPTCPDGERIFRQHEENPEIPLCPSIDAGHRCHKEGGPDKCPLWDRPTDGGGEEPEPAPMMGPNTTKPKTEETDPPAPPRRTRKKRGES
ncbi:MAG: AAA family ATPase [Dysosmobacter sp.]|nr:AAA family ATPase [Dysosmobacter sp.]